MPDTTTIQSLPLIQPSQAQKHVTHNEALKILDLIVQMTVASRTVSVPPVSPTSGDCHIVGAGATGVWAGQAGKATTFTGIVWEFYPPKIGWTAHVVDEATSVVYDGAVWTSAAENPAVFAELGVSATPDATNRLSVSSPASLFSHDGAGHVMKINKATSGDSAAILLQTSASGRAEIGTLGNDALTVKVSTDGATFSEGLRITAGVGTADVVVSGAATPSGDTKSVEIGTGAVAGSTTNVIVGSAVPGALGSMTVNTPTVTFGASVTSVMMGSAALRALHAGLGGATADATNRLAINSPATLLNNAGAGHQLKINKAASTDTASLLFQTGFSGRAEMGTSGSDDFAIKVSADGAAFTEAVAFDRATGRTKVQKGLRLTPAAGDLASPVDGEVWYDSTAAKFRARQNGVSVDVVGSGGGSTFSDAAFTLQDDVDASKQARFQLSAISTASTRTFTLPDTSGTVVLTNQTTTTLGSTTAAATLNVGAGVTISGSTKAVNLGTAGASGSTTNVAIGSAVAGALGTTTFQSPTVAFGATVTAVNLPDVATFITDNLDPAKKLQFEVSAITTGTTRTVSAPNASGAMVLDTATQTLTNKTIDLGANTITGALPAANVSVSGGGTLQDYAGFGTRAGFVAWAAGKTPAVGSIMDAAGYSYRYIGTGTAISDLPGWVPLGYAFPDHWGQNVNPGVTNMVSAILGALSYSATVYMSGGTYAVGSTLAWDNATLIGNNDRGTARTRILGLSGSIPVGQAVIAPGRSSTIRGIQIAYDALTGSETQDQRVGLDTRGLALTLQRGSVIDEVVFDNVGTAISDYGTGEFSVTYGTLEISAHSFRAVDIRGTSRTGSVWLNLYINGGATYAPEGGFCLTGQCAGGFIGQLNIEHAAYSGYPVRLEGLQGLVISSLHIEGVDCTTAGRGYVGLDSASVTIQSLNVLNSRMTTDDTAVVRLARAAYQSTAVSPLLTTVSATSSLKIGKLHVKGLASPSNTHYPSYPVGRTGVRNCPGFNVFKRDVSYTDQNWLVEVDDYLWAVFNAQAADRPLLEFPEVSYSGQVQIKRFADRGGNLVPYENYVLNGAYDKWLATTATVTSGAQEVANKWTLRGTTGSVTVDRVQDAFGAVGQYDARVTVGTAGTAQSWDQDVAFPVEWLGQNLRLTFEMKAAVAGRVLEQITATLQNNGGGSPASVVKQVLSGSDAKLDATTGFKTYVLEFTGVDPVSVTTLGTAAVMRLSFQINDTVASRAPTVTLRNVVLSKVAGAKFARAPYDRLALGTADVAGLGALATASSVNLTTQASGVLQAAQHPAHSGEVTNTAGSLALTIGAGVVSNAKLATMAANTLKGNNSGAVAAPADLTAAQVKALLAIASGDVSGLGVLATASSVNLTTQASGTLQAAQEPAHSGDVTNAAGSLALTIAANAVSNAKLATMAANTVKANATAGAAVPTDVALAASQLIGRGATGDVAPITLGTNLSMTGTTLNAAGGAGSPGGSTTQVQFNNGGAFAGAAEVLVENDQLRLPMAAGFTTPAAGGAKLVGRGDAGRTVPAFLSQDGVIREMQTGLSRSSPLIWKAQPAATTFSVIGAAAPTAVGTATAASTATTNLVAYTPRLEYLVTTAATTAIAGFRSTITTVTAGGPGAGLGGFAFVGRWGPATGVATTTSRAFFGLAAVTSAPTDVEPSTAVSCVFMGWDAADTNIQIMFNDAAGTCTKTDLGAAFAVPTTDRSALYELALYSPKGTTQSVAWLVTDLISGATASGTITTNLPATSALLGPRGWMSVGGTLSVIGIGVNGVVLDPLL